MGGGGAVEHTPGEPSESQVFDHLIFSPKHPNRWNDPGTHAMTPKSNQMWPDGNTTHVSKQSTQKDTSFRDTKKLSTFVLKDVPLLQVAGGYP